MKLVTCLTALGASIAINAQVPSFALKNGDRVVFYGDSITDNAPYTQLIEIFVTARYPKLDVTYMNAGVGGDRVTGGWMGSIDQRMTRDLLSRKPTVVTVMLGMNDAGYQPFDPKTFKTYTSGYQHIVDRLRSESPTAQVWLIRPSPYDDFTRAPGFPGGYNGVLKAYGDYVAQLATANRFELVDLNTPLARMLEKAKDSDPGRAQQIIGDRVHPGNGGHFLMMSEILKSWHASPLVSKTTIDWPSGKAKVENGKLSHWAPGHFELVEQSLPTPIDRANPEIALVLKSSDLEETLNQEMLTVTGVPPGTYDLNIDLVSVGVFSDLDFARGINLALLDTPMNKQAWKIADVTWKLCAIRYSRWRTFEVPLADLVPKPLSDALRAMEDLEAALTRERHNLAQPVSHTFDLVRKPS